MKKKNNVVTDIKILEGKIVYFKNIRGRVNIVKNDRDLLRFSKNQILVTHFLEPKMSIILPKVKGIICDVGGMFCHAATVARELLIPCIVDTKKATKLLKNGDYIVIKNDGSVWLRKKK